MFGLCFFYFLIVVRMGDGLISKSRCVRPGPPEVLEKEESKLRGKPRAWRRSVGATLNSGQSRAEQKR